MTLSQLRSFATVARCGSVKEAARLLAVTEPAVSSAVRALRRELGDELYFRAGGGIQLTPGGLRLARAAGDILGLAEQTRRELRAPGDDHTTLRIAATAAVAEFACGPLLDAYTRRHRQVAVSVQVARGTDFARLLAEHAVDVTLGSRAARDVHAQLDTVAFLRYALVIVAAPWHAYAGSKGVAPAALVDTPWMLGPSAADPSTETGAFLGRQAIAARRLRVFPSYAAALAQVAAGRGIMVAISHTIRDEVERGALIALDVRGTPLQALWHASTLAGNQRSDVATSFLQFVLSTEATQAMLTRAGGVPADRFTAPSQVSIWTAYADDTQRARQPRGGRLTPGS